MPLSEHEQRILEQLEKELSSQDPKLATAMTTGHRGSFTRTIIAILGVLAGIFILVLGVSNSLPWLGVIGFVIMFGAVVFAFSAPKKEHPFKVVDGEGPARPVTQKSAKAKGGFMQRLEERWEKRSRGE